MKILTWEQPPRAEPYETYAMRQSDDAPPGNYAPNMDWIWMRRWKAKLHGVRKGPLRVEVRKTTGNGVQVLLKIGENGHVLLSMNGTAEFGPDDFRELLDAYTEALDAMTAQRTGGADVTRP